MLRLLNYEVFFFFILCYFIINSSSAFKFSVYFCLTFSSISLVQSLLSSRLLNHELSFFCILSLISILHSNFSLFFA